nr:protein Daple-like [Ipomoea batatas]
MPTLLRSWLATPYMSGEPIVDTMGQWQDEQDYRDFTSPPSVQVLQDWVKTLGGRAAMAPIAEVWLRDTNEDRARIVREGKAAFYMGRKDMQEHLYGSDFLVTPEMVQVGVTSSVVVVFEQDIRGGSVSGNIDHASTDTSMGAVLILLAQVAPQFAPVLDCPR